MAHASDGGQRLEVLRREVGTQRTGNDGQPAAAVLGHQQRVRAAADLAGVAHAPSRRGDGSRVGHLDRRVEEVETLQEERSLLGKEDREALIHGDLRDVGFHLREIRIVGEIDSAGCARVPLHIDAGVILKRPRLQRRSQIAARRGQLLGSDVRRGDEVSRFGQAGQAGQRMHVADEAIRVARDRRAVECVAELARVIAPDQDVPGLRIGMRIAQRGERDAILRAPAAAVDLRRGVIEEIWREVFVAVRVVEESVTLDAARIHAQLQAHAFVIPRVEKDGDVVVGADDLIAFDVWGADLARIRILAADSNVEVAIVVGEMRDRFHFRRNVVAGRRFVKTIDGGGATPAGIGQISVNGDRPDRSMQCQRRCRRRRLGVGGKDETKRDNDNHRRGFQHALILRTIAYAGSTKELRFG